MSLWITSRLSSNSIDTLQKNSGGNVINEQLIKIIDLINKREWNSAKTIWVLDVINLQMDPKGFFSTFGNEYEYFVQHIRPLQSYDHFYRCDFCEINYLKKKIT